VRPATLALIGILLGGSCWLGLSRGLWTPDEPREAGISRAMSDDPGMIPALNGQAFIEKPPLYYWTTGLALRLAGGPSAAALRAVSAIAAGLTLLATFCWIARAVSRELAAIATVVLATTSVFLTSAHWVRIDALLLLFCTTAIWAAWERIGRGGGASFLALFYASLVLALWTKGLVGPALVAAGLTAHVALTRSLRPLLPLRPLAGLALMAAALGGLAVAIGLAGGAAAVKTWLWVNHVERFVHPVATGHERPLPYYLWTLPVAILPWLVPFVSLFHVRGPLWRRDRVDAALLRFALAMSTGPLALLSLSSSKREVYLLPLLPPLSLLMGAAVAGRIEQRRHGVAPGAWMTAGDWAQAVILGLLGPAPAVAFMVATRAVTPIAAVSALLGTALAGAGAVAVVRRDAPRAFWLGSASIGVAVAGIFTLIVPEIDRVKNMAPFIAQVDAALPPGAAVPAVGADETLLGIVPFCTGRRVVPLDPGSPVDAPFVLVQTVDRSQPAGAFTAGYESVAAREFGPTRRMDLLRRR
jgi:4-amino-4-deoxy-L-arabinose transferase-like glycosyltransferase